jgi:hypothetical protein
LERSKNQNWLSSLLARGGAAGFLEKRFRPFCA